LANSFAGWGHPALRLFPGFEIQERLGRLLTRPIVRAYCRKIRSREKQAGGYKEALKSCHGYQ